jgi:uncharacterized protein with GYD domain
MPRYLILLTLTEQGLSHIEKSPERAAAFRSQVEQSGGHVESLYWAVGQFDGTVIFQAPDDATATALLLKLNREGNVRTHTMRLYDPQEFQQILANV